MEKYVFNSDFTINNSGKTDLVFTSQMEKIYVLQEIESIIVKSFEEPITIDEAVGRIKTQFTPESFVLKECLEFIDKIIDCNIIVNA